MSRADQFIATGCFCNKNSNPNNDKLKNNSSKSKSVPLIGCGNFDRSLLAYRIPKQFWEMAKGDEPVVGVPFYVGQNPYQRGGIPPNAIFGDPMGIPIQQTIYRDTPAPFSCVFCGSSGVTQVRYWLHFRGFCFFLLSCGAAMIIIIEIFLFRFMGFFFIHWIELVVAVAFNTVRKWQKRDYFCDSIVWSYMKNIKM